MTRYICDCENLELPRAEYCTACDEYKNLEVERDAAVAALKRIKETGVFVGAIAQEMMDAAIDAARGKV